MTEQNNDRSALRERNIRRRSRQHQVKRRRSPQQIRRSGMVRLPEITLPRNRLLYLIPASITVIVAVIAFLASFSPEEAEVVAPNAIWLDKSWTYTGRSDADIFLMVQNLRDNRIGHVYAFTSSLKADNMWSGFDHLTDDFAEVQPFVENFLARFRVAYPQTKVYAWLEVQHGWDVLKQIAVSDFAAQLIDEIGFDGILIDAKPIVNGDTTYLSLLRQIRQKIGLDVPLIAVVPPDLTPLESGLNFPSQIAPNTAWDIEYKQRVALQADQLVVTAYHSYRDNPIDYIEWVTYQVKVYQEALEEMDTEASVLISIPNYAEELPAHNPEIETIAAAMDGITIGMQEIEMPVRYVDGFAVYSDHDLTSEDWRSIRIKLGELP